MSSIIECAVLPPATQDPGRPVQGASLLPSARTLAPGSARARKHISLGVPLDPQSPSIPRDTSCSTDTVASAASMSCVLEAVSTASQSEHDKAQLSQAPFPLSGDGIGSSTTSSISETPAAVQEASSVSDGAALSSANRVPNCLDTALGTLSQPSVLPPAPRPVKARKRSSSGVTLEPLAGSGSSRYGTTRSKMAAKIPRLSHMSSGLPLHDQHYHHHQQQQQQQQQLDSQQQQLQQQKPHQDSRAARETDAGRPFFRSLTRPSVSRYLSIMRRLDAASTRPPGSSPSPHHHHPLASPDVAKQRPDGVVIDWARRRFHILEFTRPYDSRRKSLALANIYKLLKYQPLHKKLTHSLPRGWAASVIAFSVGVRGSADGPAWTAALKHLGVPLRHHDSIIKAAIDSSLAALLDMTDARMAALRTACKPIEAGVNPPPS